MANPFIYRESPKNLYAEWPAFERWSPALTVGQIFNSGVSSYVLNQAGGLQGDPVLSLTSVSRQYQTIYLQIYSAFTLQGPSGYAVEINNTRCGWPSSGAEGFVIDGIISQFSFNGRKGKLRLADVPQNINAQAIWLQFSLSSAFNVATFPAPGGNYYLASSHRVCLHGFN